MAKTPCHGPSTNQGTIVIMPELTLLLLVPVLLTAVRCAILCIAIVAVPITIELAIRTAFTNSKLLSSSNTSIPA